MFGSSMRLKNEKDAEKNNNCRTRTDSEKWAFEKGVVDCRAYTQITARLRNNL